MRKTLYVEVQGAFNKAAVYEEMAKGVNAQINLASEKDYNIRLLKTRGEDEEYRGFGITGRIEAVDEEKIIARIEEHLDSQGVLFSMQKNSKRTVATVTFTIG